MIKKRRKKNRFRMEYATKKDMIYFLKFINNDKCWCNEPNCKHKQNKDEKQNNIY